MLSGNPRTGANRRLMATMLAAVLGIASCGAPPTPATPSASLGAEPTGASQTALASSPAPGTAALPAIDTLAELPVVGVISLAPAVDGAWYVATGTIPTVGLLSATGIVRSGVAGPAPVAIAASGSDVFLVEGAPETGPPGLPRTDVLERLDAATFDVLAAAPLTELTTAVTHTDRLVWTIGTEGTIVAHDDRTLATVWTGRLEGHGPATITSGSDAVWAAIGDVGEGTEHGRYVVARIGLTDDHPVLVTTVAGDGVGPVIAADAGAWLAVADYPVFDRLYAIDASGHPADPTLLPVPAGMAVGDGRLWWVGVDGSVGAIDGATQARTPKLVLPGGSGAAIAVDRAIAYVAAGDQVFVLTVKAPTP